MSLSKQIIAYLASQYPLAVHSGELERMAMENQYKASNCGRRCRELENEGLIEVIYNKKHEATYRYIPASENPIVNQFLKDFEVKEDEDKQLTMEF